MGETEAETGNPNIDCECVVQDLADGQLKVLAAPQLCWVSAELYDELAAGSHHPKVEAGEGWLVIHGVDGTVRYRLVGAMHDRNAWLARRSS